MVGWTLLETGQHHGLPLNGTKSDSNWDYVTLGEGPGSIEDHVIFPKGDFERVGPCNYQEANLLRVSEENTQPTCARHCGPAAHCESPAAARAPSCSGCTPTDSLHAGRPSGHASPRASC